MTPPAIELAWAGASVDPVVRDTDAGPRIVGLYVRQVGDAFCFTPDPTLPVALEASPEAIEADLPLFEESPVRVSVVDLSCVAKERWHRLRIPVVGEPLASRVWWSVQAIQDSGPVLEIDRVAQEVMVYHAGLQDEKIDLILNPDSVVTLDLGDGFSVITKGDRYAFQLLFRLVANHEGEVTLRFVQTGGRLSIYLGGARPFDGTFILTPHARREEKFLGERRVGSLRFSPMVVAVAGPFPPRAHLAIASLPTSPVDVPISLDPDGKEPASSFPLVVLAERDGAMFPTAGPRSQKAMWGALSALLICGDVGPTLVAWALQNFRCVGIAAHSLDGLYGVLPPSAHRLLNRQDAEANRFVHGENIIWAVKLPAYGETEPNSGYARQWAIIEDLALDMVSAIAEWPSGRLDSAKRTWGSRLPSLPTSPDVAVAMVTAVINRQRGRAGFDDGAQQPDYGRYAEPDLWLCAPRTEDLGGQPEAIIQLTLHGVAEYWAAGIFASLPSRVAAGPTTEIDEIREHAVRLIRSWEVRDGAVSNTMHGDFARRSRGVPARQLMTVLTEAFLSIFEANLADPRGYLTSYARCINPLVLVVAEGSGGVDDTMTLSAAYWAAFAAAYSAAKPAALVPTLLLDGASLKLVSLHRDLRLAIHGYVPHSIKDQTRIHATRTAIGVTLAHRLIASTTVLHAAGADRIIAIASVLLDFIPVGDTILGLEVPVSRIPFSSPKTAFLHLNFLAMSSAAAGALQGSACILAPVVAKDTAEHWALDMQERLSLLLPSLGLQPPPRGDAGDLLFAMLERSGIVFFVGHAMAADAWGGLNLGDQWLGADALGRVEWTGKIAILIGCETAALDAAKGDIGRTLVELGARAVVGATAKISTDAAELFLVQFMRAAMAGEAIDYAFFIARRLVVLAEAIAAQGEAWPDASRKAIDLLDRDPQAPFGEILASAGLTWEKAYRAAVYGLSFTLLGGATERIR